LIWSLGDHAKGISLAVAIMKGRLSSAWFFIALPDFPHPDSCFWQETPEKLFQTIASWKMSVQVTAGVGSLVALGVSAGDVATLITIGRKFGNWWTAASGDEDLLKALDGDENLIIQRRGVLDPIRWNQIWGEKMTLLANGTATTYTGPLVKKTLGKLPRITACMVTIISTLDAFAATVAVKNIFKQLLLSLWNRQKMARICCFQSWIVGWMRGDLRGLRELHFKAQTIRRSLIQSKRIQDGVVPIGEAQEIVMFCTGLWPKTTMRSSQPLLILRA
jgi:hypothetical protein